MSNRLQALALLIVLVPIMLGAGFGFGVQFANGQIMLAAEDAQLRLDLALERLRLPNDCVEDAVIIGAGAFRKGRWDYYKCGPSADDYGSTDVNGDGVTDVLDVQLVVNGFHDGPTE